jgi:hypothetical protein
MLFLVGEPGIGKTRTAEELAARAERGGDEGHQVGHRRIAAADPALGGHFSGSVRTGHVCSYDPERPVDWTT